MSSILSQSALLMAAVSTAAAATAQTEGDVGGWCERQWQAESAAFVSKRPNGPDFEGLIKRWETYGSKCKGTGAFEARLAIAMAQAGSIESAKKALAPAEGRKSDFPYLIEAARLQIATWEAVRPQEQDVRHRLMEIERGYRRLVQAYPDWLPAYGLLGGLQTTLALHQDAIQNLERARSAQGDLWGVHRNLAISYATTKRYSNAMDAANDAIEANAAATSDPDFMYALATASAMLGDMKTAHNALRILAAKRPSVRDDADFARVARLVQEQTTKANSQSKK